MGLDCFSANWRIAMTTGGILGGFRIELADDEQSRRISYYG